MADMNQYYVTLYAPIVAVDRSILEYGVGTILAIYGMYHIACIESLSSQY